MTQQPPPNPPPSSGWTNPQILVAVIGAVTTVVVTVIGVLPSIIASTQPPTPTPTPIIITTTPIVLESTIAPPTIEPTKPPQMNDPATVTPLPTLSGQPTAITLEPRSQPASGDTNVQLMYDDVSFTLLNTSGGTLSLEGISFRSSGGTWDAENWGPSIYTNLPNDRCLRLRDMSVGSRQPPTPCVNKIYGLIEVGNTAFFWIDVEQFEVLRDGSVIATCAVSAGECDVYIG